MHNNEFKMWAEHDKHDLTVEIVEFSDMDELGILCHTCKKLVQVWEFIPEYEDNYEEA